VELIQNGRVAGMIVGGCESAVEALGLIGFSRLRALSSGDCNGEGQPRQLDNRSSRPFDATRDGFVLAEGAAMLVLEEHEHAVSRGANILAEVVGVGYSGDGFHITAPQPSGEGAARAMQNAVRDAQITGMENIDYINAHATSTPVGDVAELRAIRLAVSQSERSTKPLYVSSTKGVTGHLLGAAGAIEAALAVSAVADQIVPHTQNLIEISGDILQVLGDGERTIHLVQNEPLHQEVNLSMSNSFGFGGTNVSLLFARYS
jgi:3-oxoacyl-[acyl-carrier-protein] synthase II